MPKFKDYKDNSTLQELIATALEDPDIQKGIAEVNGSERLLIAEVNKHPEIMTIVEKEIEEYDYGVVTYYLLQNTHKLRVVQICLGVIIFIISVTITLVILKPALSAGHAKEIIINSILAVLLPAIFLFIMVELGLRRPLSSEDKMSNGIIINPYRARTTLRGIIEGMQSRIERKIIESAIKEIIRSYLNKLITPSYSIQFEVSASSGLGEVANQEHTINTTAEDSLAFLLNNMPGGSIGISGPRGAGKSTLIQSYCGPKSSVKVKGKKAITTMVSAPVEYLGRDFILHLFSTVCKAYLNNKGVNSREFDVPGKTSSTSKLVAKFRPPFFFLTLYIGGLCIVDPLIVIKYKTALPPYPSMFRAIITLSGIEQYPALFFWLGIALVAASIYFFLLRRKYQRGYNQSFEKNANKEDLSLIHEAIDWLREIKFQRSYTTGWSGALKLPVGLEGGANRVESYTYRQLSNPEVVGAFVQFLNKIADTNPVIIGIDELDKIESDESAQKFLNEIKAVFGQPACFFLVSVSENAMSQFERRGLPVRDTFDSSFDAVIQVDYLSYKMSQNLLERRVIGKPVPFFCLSHCLSGGLPREIIRIFRHILELNHRGINDLSGLCEALIKQDIVSKVRATRIFLKNKEDEHLAGPLLSVIYDLEIGNFSKEIILEGINRLHALEYHGQGLESKIALMAQLNKTRYELLGYLYLIAALLQFFSNSLTGDILKSAEESLDIELLARARQSLAVDPVISINYVNKFRDNQNISW